MPTVQCESSVICDGSSSKGCAALYLYNIAMLAQARRRLDVKLLTKIVVSYCNLLSVVRAVLIDLLLIYPAHASQALRLRLDSRAFASLVYC